MRILHVVGTLDRGGAETWLLQVLKHIDRTKYQFDFLVNSIEPGAYDKEVRALGARIIPCPKAANPFQYAFNFCRILDEYGPYDCVHSHIHHFSGYVLLLAAVIRVPIRIVQSHSDTQKIDQSSSSLRKAYLLVMKTLIHLLATVSIAVSEPAAQALFGPSRKSDPRWSVCSLGIDLWSFDQEFDSQEVRTELGIPSDAFVVGHVGRFVEPKNHRFILEIAERMCWFEPKTVFLLVGDGPLKPGMEERVRATGLSENFIFAGVRNDVPKLMKGAMDCFLFPSSYEGLGLVLWEAQAAGLTCFATDSLPKEANIGQGLMKAISLTSSADQWAECILSSRTYAKLNTSIKFPKEFTIEESVRRLCSLYTLPNQ